MRQAFNGLLKVICIQNPLKIEYSNTIFEYSNTIFEYSNTIFESTDETFALSHVN